MRPAKTGPSGARVLYVAEPAAAWLQRAPVVADCSVVAALVFAESACDQAAALLSHKAVHAPALLPFEMASVACKKQRAGIDAARVSGALRDFAEQRIALHEVPPDAVAELALRYDLSAYDCAYLWLAAELKAPLVTFDRKLGSVAKRHLGQLE